MLFCAVAHAQTAQKSPSAPSDATKPADVAKETAKQKAQEERCAQLFAQGQTALAQAEGCGGNDRSRWSGSILTFSQTMAPAWRTFPNPNDPFYALNAYIAPRFSLTERWALVADFSVGYEVTAPDDGARRRKVSTSDTRLIALGNLGTWGGFTFTGGPRVVIPTSEVSWALKTYVGAGLALNVVRSFDWLSGAAFTLGGTYLHIWSGALTAQVRGEAAPPCAAAGATRESTTACGADGARTYQDIFRASGAFSLSVTPELSLQLSYLHLWYLIKPFPQGHPTVPIASGSAVVDDGAPLPDSRVRRYGELDLGVSYQVASWLIATLQGTTGVCYDQQYGGQSANPRALGCAGGLKTSDFWLRNPIANKFSTVSLQLTVPLDALAQRIRAARKASPHTGTANASRSSL